jgi:hypothetical protein
MSVTEMLCLRIAYRGNNELIQGIVACLTLFMIEVNYKYFYTHQIPEVFDV